jgi:hypothetical protein
MAGRWIIFLPFCLFICLQITTNVPANVPTPTVTLTAPDDVTLGLWFGVSVNVSNSWSGDATVSTSGTAYSTTSRSETYWNVDSGTTSTTVAYAHEFGSRVHDTAISISNGSGSFVVTQYKMQPFTLTVTLSGGAGSGVKSYTKEHVWALVKQTQHTQIPENNNEDTNAIGTWLNNQPRGALPWGATSLMNSWIVCKVNLIDVGTEVKIRDRGPNFPLSPYYPANNNWYNVYWNEGGWAPLAVLMNGLHRASSDPNLRTEINGAGLDLSPGARSALQITENGNILWRFRD